MDMNRMNTMILTLSCFTVLLCVEQAFPRVKLITLPVRERVEIQLDHSQATLVEEERFVPLVKGINQVDFSWSGTRIDPGTIVFRVLEPAGNQAMQVNVLSVSYPPNENALVWQVASDRSGSARVRISYLLGGLDKTFNYRAVAENNESRLALSQYIRVKNFAGEAYDDTHIHAGYGGKFVKPIGLNETKEMLVERVSDIPINKTYTCDAEAYGYLDKPQNKLRVPMHYVIMNDEGHNLGRAPLPDGKVRIFQKDSQGTSAFIGEDWGRFTPIDDEMELYLGIAQDIVVRRTIDQRESTRAGGDRYHYDVVVKYEIENFKDQSVVLNVVEDIDALRREAGCRSNQPAEWVLGSQTTFTDGPDPRYSSHERIRLDCTLPPRKGDKAEKIIHKLHLVFRNQW